MRDLFTRSPAGIASDLVIIVAVSVVIIGFVTLLHTALPAIGA